MSAKGFKFENGSKFKGLNLTSYAQLLKDLDQEYGLRPVQIVESAAYSGAMVLRVALGYSAQNASVLGLVTPGLAGAAVLATIRNLVNAGTQSAVYEVPTGEEFTEYEQQKSLLSKLGVDFFMLDSAAAIPDFIKLAEVVHTVIFGIQTAASMLPAHISEAINQLNEIQTPSHAFVIPAGVNAESGERIGTPQFAASTIAFGLPLSGLSGNDYTGRVYLADISIPQAVYDRYAPELKSAFAEQPVVQIFPCELD